jgi:hypothetical protein
MPYHCDRHELSRLIVVLWRFDVVVQIYLTHFFEQSELPPNLLDCPSTPKLKKQKQKQKKIHSIDSQDHKIFTVYGM